VRVRAVLERAIHTGDQRELLSEWMQRLQSGREGHLVSADWSFLALEPPYVVLVGEIRQLAIGFAREKSPASQTVRQIEEPTLARKLRRETCRDDLASLFMFEFFKSYVASVLVMERFAHGNHLHDCPE